MFLSTNLVLGRRIVGLKTLACYLPAADATPTKTAAANAANATNAAAAGGYPFSSGASFFGAGDAEAALRGFESSGRPSLGGLFGPPSALRNR